METQQQQPSIVTKQCRICKWTYLNDVKSCVMCSNNQGYVKFKNYHAKKWCPKCRAVYQDMPKEYCNLCVIKLEFIDGK